MTTATGESKPLSRYRRSPREVDFVLTKRDLEIMQIVESYRLLTSAHIRALVEGSGQGIVRRLQKLFHKGYLDRLRPQRIKGGGSPKMTYAITNKGHRELQKEGLISEPTKTDWNEKNRAVGDLFINHRLLITEVRALIEIACRSRQDLRLLFWQEGKSTYDAIEVNGGHGSDRVPVAPDAFFGIQDAQGKMFFFLEADRGTMTLKRFTRKLRGYAAYWRKKKHKDKFGIRYFRVLTVTSSPVRRANLVSSAQKAKELKGLERMFLFSEESRLSLDRPENILKPIWTQLGDTETHSVLD